MRACGLGGSGSQVARVEVGRQEVVGETHTQLPPVEVQRRRGRCCVHTQSYSQIHMSRLKKVFQRCTCQTTTGGGAEEGRQMLRTHTATQPLNHIDMSRLKEVF